MFLRSINTYVVIYLFILQIHQDIIYQLT